MSSCQGTGRHCLPPGKMDQRCKSMTSMVIDPEAERMAKEMGTQRNVGSPPAHPGPLFPKPHFPLAHLAL